MTGATAWALVLAGIAAVAATASVVLWFVDRSLRRREAPAVELHVNVVAWADSWLEAHGRESVHVVIANAGDGIARHLVVQGSGTFRVEHHHEQGRQAALAPGQQLELPASWERGESVDLTISWLEGPGATRAPREMHVHVSPPPGRAGQ